MPDKKGDARGPGGSAGAPKPKPAQAASKPGPVPDHTIAALLDETRDYPPPTDFVRAAHYRDESIYTEAAKDYEGFWSKQALAASRARYLVKSDGVR